MKTFDNQQFIFLSVFLYELFMLMARNDFVLSVHCVHADDKGANRQIDCVTKFKHVSCRRADVSLNDH